MWITHIWWGSWWQNFCRWFSLEFKKIASFHFKSLHDIARIPTFYAPHTSNRNSKKEYWIIRLSLGFTLLMLMSEKLIFFESNWIKLKHKKCCCEWRQTLSKSVTCCSISQNKQTLKIHYVNLRRTFSSWNIVERNCLFILEERCNER